MEDAQNTQECAEKKVIGRPFEKGNSGKAPGTLNKLTKAVRDTVLEVFNKLQDDPEHNLEAFAKNDPRTFYNIAAKLIPQEIAGHIEVTKTEIKLIFPEPRGTTSNDNGTADAGSN